MPASALPALPKFALRFPRNHDSRPPGDRTRTQIRRHRPVLAGGADMEPLDRGDSRMVLKPVCSQVTPRKSIRRTREFHGIFFWLENGMEADNSLSCLPGHGATRLERRERTLVSCT